MPGRLLRGCSGRSGCPNLVTRGPCDECRRSGQVAYDDRRGTSASRGYDARWARTSRHLREHVIRTCGERADGAPLTSDSVCQQEGRFVPLAHGGGVIDHIVPVRGSEDPRFYDRTNWQGLCHTCHNAKRQREQQAAMGIAS